MFAKIISTVTLPMRVEGSINHSI